MTDVTVEAVSLDSELCHYLLGTNKIDKNWSESEEGKNIAIFMGIRDTSSWYFLVSENSQITT